MAFNIRGLHVVSSPILEPERRLRTTKALQQSLRVKCQVTWQTEEHLLNPIWFGSFLSLFCQSALGKVCENGVCPGGGDGGAHVNSEFRV